jgi:hypothetical protein
MKAKSALIIGCLVVASLMLVTPSRAEAQCCWGEYIAAPFVAAGAVVAGAAVVSAAIVTAPFTAFSCNTCGVSLCNPCGVTYTPPPCNTCCDNC